jgi:hypothetical protein
LKEEKKRKEKKRKASEMLNKGKSKKRLLEAMLK